MDEPQSCSYVLTVHTTRICHHPFLRPPAGAAPQPILCQPALSPAQYVEYVRAQVCEYQGDTPPTRWAVGPRHGGDAGPLCPSVPSADTKRKVEEISEELKTLDTRLWSERDTETPAQSPEGVPAAHGDGTARVPCLPPR